MTTLDSHYCSEKELGISNETTDSKSLFYPVEAGSRYDVQLHKDKFRCMDPDDLEIYGSYNSFRAKQLIITVDRCVNTTEVTNCKSDEEIDKFLRNKYVLFVYNQRLFNMSNYGYESISMKSHVSWIKVSNQISRIVPFEIYTTQQILQDYRINLDDITELEFDNNYGIRQLTDIPFEYENGQKPLLITVEVSPDLLLVIREGYGILDWISDVGGL